MQGFYYTEVSTLIATSPTLIPGVVIELTDIAEVYSDIAEIIVNNWPGELWFVETLPLDDALQTIQIKLLKKLPCSLLFGAQGEKVCHLIEAVTHLSVDHIEQLALLATPMAEEAYSNAWNCWLAELDGKEHDVHLESDHRGTLAIGKGVYASPIYGGFLLIDQLMQHKASQLVGESALISQTLYGETITQLTPVWSQACSVLLQAAMGLGAVNYTTPQELELLLAGWDLLKKLNLPMPN